MLRFSVQAVYFRTKLIHFDEDFWKILELIKTLRYLRTFPKPGEIMKEKVCMHFLFRSISTPPPVGVDSVDQFRSGEARYVVVLASAVQAGDGHQFCFQRDQLHPADWNSGFLQPARNRKRPELAQIFSGVLMVHSGKHLERYGSSS